MIYIFVLIFGIVIGETIFGLYLRVQEAKKRKKKRTQKKEKQVREKPNFTKMVLSFVLLTYFVGLGVGVYVTLKDYSLFGVLATYIATPTTTVIALYCWKAKAENIIKLKQEHPEETKEMQGGLEGIQ